MLGAEKRKRAKRSPDHVSPPIPTKACRYCKSRKVKCDSFQQVPCSTCVKAKKECVPSNDGRSLRPSTHEVVDLQKRVAQLESYIETLTRGGGGREDGTTGGGASSVSPVVTSVPAARRAVDATAPAPAKRYPKPKEFQRIGTSTVGEEVYGPTSIFHSSTSPIKEYLEDRNLLSSSRGKGRALDGVDDGGDDDDDDDEVSLKKLNKDPTVIKYIKCFFQWLYPDIHMFIPRETFLIDFYHPRSSGRQSYCTIELVYSICAIGSLLVQDDDEDGGLAAGTTRMESESYYGRAKRILFAKLDMPSITAMQSFILLGLYDMYRGRNNSCWLLSGIGLRIGFDIGFHLSPKLTNSRRSINKLSLLFKSRIYWGCFIVDHFIGMILGRPSVLHIDNSTIGQSERVPDLDWIKDFNFKEKDIIDVSNPLKSIVRLIVLTERSTHGIFMLETELAGKYERLLRFNTEIQQWREDLLPELQWDDIADIRAKSSKPPDMVHVYYYYIVLLCVNRPFLDVEEASLAVRRRGHLASELTEYQRQIRRSVITPAVATLDVAVSGFVSKYGYKRCSILIVYSSILVASVILVLMEKTKKRAPTAVPANSAAGSEVENNGAAAGGDRDADDNDDNLADLHETLISNLNVLRQSGSVWALAADSFAMFERKLQDDFAICFVDEYERMQQSPRGMAGLPAWEASTDDDFGTEWTEWMGLLDVDFGATAAAAAATAVPASDLVLSPAPNANDFGLGVLDFDGLCPQ